MTVSVVIVDEIINTDVLKGSFIIFYGLSIFIYG
jgi:hypothetical protein